MKPLGFHGSFRTLCAATVLLLAWPAVAQEPVATILDRGYGSSWLVCGPFPLDADTRDSSATPLDRADPFAASGGIGQLRPHEGVNVVAGDTTRAWSKVVVQTPTVPFEKVLTGSEFGIVLAATQLNSKSQQLVLFDLQTTVVSRVFLNGFPIREVLSPTSMQGVFAVEFRPGQNLILLEMLLPKAESSSAAVGASHSFTLEIAPLAKLGDIAYVPQLKSSGRFSSQRGGARQEAILTLFNPMPRPSPPIRIQAIPRKGSVATDIVAPAVPPESHAEVLLEMNVGKETSGQQMAVDVSLWMGAAKVSFSGAILVKEPPQPGKVYYVAGRSANQQHVADQRTGWELRMGDLLRQIQLAEQEKGYGFDLGVGEEWTTFLKAHPERLNAVAKAIQSLQCGFHAGFTIPDERIVSGDLLVRNLAYGYYSALAITNVVDQAYTAWEAPAVTPQTPQLLTSAKVLGIVTNLHCKGVPELFRYVSPNGASIPLRRIKTAVAPRNLDDLMAQAPVHRRELLDQGIASDVIIGQSLTEPPEPFWLEETDRLAQSLPSIVVSGAGPSLLFEDIRSQDAIAGTGRILNTFELGAVSAQPYVKLAHASTQNLVRCAEKWCAISSTLGFSYPEPELDYAWRQLLYSSSPKRIGYCESATTGIDLLANLRNAADVAAQTLRKSTAFVASNVDTLQNAGKTSPDSKAVVVFNPSSWTRTDVCRTRVSVAKSTGINVVDISGENASFIILSGRRIPGGGAELDIEFVAVDVPSVGYKTYYIVQGRALAPSKQSQGSEIENEFLRILVDPNRGGCITSLKDKRTGTEYSTETLNDVLLMREDRTKTHGGLDFWTTGDIVRLSSSPAQVTISKTPGIQKVSISAAFAGGTLDHTLVLYAGIPRLDCELYLTGASVANNLLAITFRPPHEGRLPVLGERFGASIGRQSKGVFDFQTNGAENVSASGIQPALYWAALSSNASISVEHQATAPIGPTAIVRGEDASLSGTADHILNALLSLDIPATIWPSEPRSLNVIYSDSTEFPNFNDDLAYGTVFRIVLGGPDQNTFCKHLFADLPLEIVESFTDRQQEGAYLLLFDHRTPKEFKPIPTFVISGNDLNGTDKAARRFAETLRIERHFSIPERALVADDTGGAELPPPPTNGFAVLHMGSAIHSVERDGAMAMILAHGSEWKQTLPETTIDCNSDRLAFRYSLFPFERDWRSASVPREGLAINEPFTTSITGLHMGSLPVQQSFISIEGSELLVTSIKASGYPSASMKPSTAATDSLRITAYEPFGAGAQSRLALSPALRGGYWSNPLEQNMERMPLRERKLMVETQPNGIVHLAAITGARKLNSIESPEKTVDDLRIPTFTRFWLHNVGAAPQGNLPISVLLDGNLRQKEDPLKLIIANNLSNKSVRGTVLLTAADGWRLSEREIPYDLGPFGLERHEILVFRSGSESESGGVFAKTAIDGQIYMDVLQLDKEIMKITAKKSGKEIVVTVANRGAIPLEGFGALITPGMDWSANTFGEMDSQRTAKALAVPQFQEQRFVFFIEDDLPWLVFKAAANGRVAYTKID